MKSFDGKKRSNVGRKLGPDPNVFKKDVDKMHPVSEDDIGDNFTDGDVRIILGGSFYKNPFGWDA